MADKIDPGKFTLRFNLNDPQQRAAVDILNRLGRQKSQFVARALLHYSECTDMSLMATPAPVDEHKLEQAILAVLSKHPSFCSSQSPVIKDEPIDPLEPPQSEQVETTSPHPVSDSAIPDESLNAINKTMKAFWYQ